MRKVFATLFIFLLTPVLFGQAIQKSGQNLSTNASVKMYAGEEYMPYLFEPYQADYVFRGDIFGFNFNVFTFSTKIVELEDEWVETQVYNLPVPDRKFQHITLTSRIDLKTGLLKEMHIETNAGIDQRIEIGTDRILITETKGKKVKQISFEAREKIYPCSFSNTFLSYLPLNDNFSASFGCFLPDETASGKPAVKFQKRTLRVVGSETIYTPAGKYDTWKLADETEEIKYDREGNVKERKKKPLKMDFDEEKFWANFYSNSWIDKKTRKFVKGELNFKVGTLTIEIQRPRLL